ncbi:MAG: T9SS type A sorting domain-containing protein [Ginsengibacter sp.]
MGGSFFEKILRQFTRESVIKGKRRFLTSGLIVFVSLFFGQLFLSSKLFAQVPDLDFSYSYVNVTRNNGGGTLETGDIIEVRALINIMPGSTITNVYFISPVPAGTEYVPNSMKMISNEGATLKSYSDVGGSDVGVYDPAVPGIRVNICTSPNNAGVAYGGAGFYSTSGGGTVVGGDIPRAANNTMSIFSFRLKVTANFGDIINPTATYYYTYSITTGSGRHKKTTKYPSSHDFSYSGIKIVQNLGLCANFSSASFTAESSFGSGKTQNRPAGVNAPGYSKTDISTGSPNDGFYSIANNTSGDGSTITTVPYKTAGSPRVFGAWDIVGDHTNATDPNAGNAPVSPGTTGGYMLVVNANITTGEVYRDIIQNLCPNTYYEFSAWIRNLCGQCGADIEGNAKGPGNHGVMPNLTYAINDIDYYTTGNITYTNSWAKRGFIYKTGPTETSFSITIKNNASGGDGNDWVLDDINLATCYPNLIMNPNDTATACAGYPITITDTVRSYYNNYGNYQWESSPDGNVWHPMVINPDYTLAVGNDPKTTTPILKNGLYEYYVNAVFLPVTAYNGNYFRLKVATTQSNLTNPSCSVDKSQKVYLKVYSGDACRVLNTGIKNFSGSVINNKNVLKWTVANDGDVKEYVIEKSVDGVSFSDAGIVLQGESNGDNYTFTDPANNSSINYYRLKIVSGNNSPAGYSKTILLYNRSSSAFKISTINPFHDDLKVEVFLPAQGKVDLNLYDMYGKSLSKKVVQLSKGNSQTIMDDVAKLPAGMYILTAFYNGMVVQNKLIKNN